MISVRRMRHNRSVRARALKIAQAETGVKESPPNTNDGPRVRDYQAVTGQFRAAWCASFVAWAYKQAGHELKGWNTAYCPAYVQRSRTDSQLRQVLARNVQPGDLALFDWGNDGVADHIGIVSSRVVDGTFSTIEGNTSTGTFGSQSNGGCVAARRRNVKDVAAFLRVVAS